jgi:hypothetical protein
VCLWGGMTGVFVGQVAQGIITGRDTLICTTVLQSCSCCLNIVCTVSV